MNKMVYILTVYGIGDEYPEIIGIFLNKTKAQEMAKKHNCVIDEFKVGLYN